MPSSISSATASSSDGKAPIVCHDTKSTPPRYSTILPKLPLPVIPCSPTSHNLPPPPPPKDFPAPPSSSEPEFVACPNLDSRKMHISLLAFVLLLVLLFLESTVIFIYTTIGLVKNNPLPYLYAPILPQYPLCQSNVQADFSLRYGLNVADGTAWDEQQTTYTTSVTTVTLTTMITQMPSFTSPVLPHLEPVVSQEISTTTMYASRPVTPEEPVSITTVTLFTTSTTPAPTTTTTLDVDPVVTSVVFSTIMIDGSQSGIAEAPESTFYITTVVPAAETTSASDLLPTATTPTTTTAEATTLIVRPNSLSLSATTTAFSTPTTTTTLETSEVVTSVVFSTTVIPASQTNNAEVPKSTVYLTTIVPGRL